MSIGLAFVKGLVGGFSKNIEREREARGEDDARIAELENFVFHFHGHLWQEQFGGTISDI